MTSVLRNEQAYILFIYDDLGDVVSVGGEPFGSTPIGSVLYNGDFFPKVDRLEFLRQVLSV